MGELIGFFRPHLFHLEVKHAVPVGDQRALIVKKCVCLFPASGNKTKRSPSRISTRATGLWPRPEDKPSSCVSATPAPTA